FFSSRKRDTRFSRDWSSDVCSFDLGRFDCVLGVLAGLEIVRELVDHNIKPKIPITVVNFTNEEGARFEPSMMASGVLSGKFEKRSEERRVGKECLEQRSQ